MVCRVTFVVTFWNPRSDPGHMGVGDVCGGICAFGAVNNACLWPIHMRYSIYGVLVL